jgi:DNA (cytosine-5)-methyltransferase 1
MDEGLRRAGFRHLLLCESDSWRRGVLAERFPGVPIADDVRDVGHSPGRAPRGEGQDAIAGRGGACAAARPVADDLEAGRELHADGRDATVGLLCGGFPCQDLSVAGQRRGLAGDRSSLFYEFARVAETLRPGWLLVENVPGLLSSDGGRDFGIVLGTLADLGYGLAWRILDSRHFGVPQRRRRVFIVGRLADRDPRAAADRAGQVLAVGTRCPGHSQARGEAGEDVAVASLSGLGSGGPDDNDGQGGRGPEETLIADTLTSGSHPGSNMPGRRREDDTNIVAFHPTGGGEKGLSATENETPGGGFGNGGAVGITDGAMVRRLTPVECERLQGFPDHWTRVPDNAPDSRRYAALGDAVTVPVAEWIGRRIRSAT